MAIKKKIYRLRGGTVLDIDEFHDGRYGGPGGKREKKREVTPEQMKEANHRTKVKNCQRRMLQYFRAGDCFATLTYAVQNRPATMEQAVDDFRKAWRKVRSEYKKRGKELFWIRNVERGTKGAWHIHILINEVGDTATILQKAWKKGGVYIETVKQNKWYDVSFGKLAEYMTKDGDTQEEKEDGTLAKPKLKEASYNHSRNMPLPDPEKKYLKRWKEEVKPPKGYYIADYYEGINPKTGYKYRRYTLISLERRREEDGDRHLHRAKRKRSTRKKP